MYVGLNGAPRRHLRSHASALLIALASVTLVFGSAAAQTPAVPPTMPPGGPVAEPPPPTVAARPSVQRVAPPTDPVLIDDPVAYWLLDDPTGALAADSVRAPRLSHDGSYSGAVTATSDSPGHGLAGARIFAGGACDGVVVDPSAAYVTGDMAVEGWVRTTAPSGVLFRWRWFGYLLRVSGGTASFESSNGAGGGFVGGTSVNGTTVVNDGRWHHLAAVRTSESPARLLLYVDGSLDATATAPVGSTTTFYGSPPEAAIGRDGFACDNAIPSMRGLIAAVAIFDKALTPAQVTAHARISACGNLDRVHCYAPELRFHPSEEYFPMDADQWIAESELKWASDHGCRNVVVSRSVNATNLTNGTFTRTETDRTGLGWRNCTETGNGKRYSTLEFTRPFQRDTARNGEPRACSRVRNAQGQLVVPSAQNGLVCPAALQTATAEYLTIDEGFYLNHVGPAPKGPVPDADNRINPPVYVEEWPDRISYWFFYGKDPKGFFPHEGDWENIEVEFGDGPTAAPTKIIYLAHACRTNTPTDGDREVLWANASLAGGTHPIVYPSLDTHASWPRDDVAAFSALDRLRPRVCGQPAVGSTDQTAFNPATSTVWKSWNNVKHADQQCWYGFGGAWGDTGFGVNTELGPIPIDWREVKTGPQGPPYADAAGQVRVAKTAGCARPRIGAASIAPSSSSADPTTFAWAAPVQGSATGGVPGTAFTVALQSIPTLVTTGSVDASGNSAFSFAIPVGTAPGIHALVIRDTANGEELYNTSVSVVAPVECISTGPTPADDTDDDLVRDACDPNSLDGPVADLDGDGIANGIDNCPTVPNTDQAVRYERSEGAACDVQNGYNPLGPQQPPAPVRSGECAVCALDPSSETTLNGNATLSAVNRSVAINGSLRAIGQSSATASGYGSAVVVGGRVTTTGQATVAPITVGTTTDPFATLALPSAPPGSSGGDVSLPAGSVLPAGTWASVTMNGPGTRTLQPGTFGSISATGQAKVVLKPGTYVVTGALSLNAASLDAIDATVVFTCGTAGAPVGCTSVPGGSLGVNASTVTMSSTGPMPVILYDRANTAPIVIGASELHVSSLYAKAARLTLQGSTLTASTGAKIAVASLTINGNSSIATRAATIG